MIESRLTSVILLDGVQLDFFVTSELITYDLLEMVAAHLCLIDKEYFSLSFIDATGHRNWLQPERKILDHDFPKKSGVLILLFSVKFFIENIAFTKDRYAVEQFYLQTRSLIYQGDLEVSNELIFELGGLILQSLFGDFKNEKEALKGIKSQNVFPKRFFIASNQIAVYEQKTIAYYKKCNGMNRGQCIVNFLSITEKLCNYGVHYYEVKDKLNIKWYLGISYRGIGLYDFNNKIISKKVFPWSKLENLYYRDRKFSIEVHEPLNLNSTSPSNIESEINAEDTLNPVKVYAWFASIPTLCKSIWLMAVAQHQFFLDKKQTRDNISQFKSLNDLALELNNTSLKSFEINFPDEVTIKNKEIAQDKQNLLQKNHEKNTSKNEISQLLKKKRELVQKSLDLKKKELEEINSKHKRLKEITTQAINDRVPMNALISALKEFKNSNSINNHYKKEILSNFYSEYDIQKKIMLLSLTLASDPLVSHSLQKQRREFYEKSKLKLSKLEKKIEKETQKKKENFAEINSSSFNFNDIREKINETSSAEVKFCSVAEVSPASIHRKDSYRKAQEQKLFLESNCVINKQNRYGPSRKVRTLINQNSLSQNMFENLNNNHTKMLNCNFPGIAFSNLEVFNENTMQIQTNSIPLPGNQLTEKNDFANSNQREHLNGILPNLNQTSSNFRPFFLNSKSLINNEIQEATSNMQANGHGHLEEMDFHKNMNSSRDMKLNSPIDMCQAPTLMFNHRKNGQRKNTSDSNVKLLADHNFYHVTNKRNLNEYQHKDIGLIYKEIPEFSSKTNLNCSNEMKPNEINDYLKYGMKFKRGGNSSSNSLMSLNSSSIGTNEELNVVNSDREIIRSNPDIKSALIHSPRVSIYSNQETSISRNGPITDSSKKILTENNNQGNQSTNMSLNLSIHTAEEFGIEMLAWLNSESNVRNNDNYKYKLDNELNESKKLATNATLV